MVRVDYISTTDINKVAKIHSSQKYFNWIMKMVDDEYRFYPPISIEDNDLDDFDFDGIYDEEFNLDEFTKVEAPMYGESESFTFIPEERFQFRQAVISELDTKKGCVKKGMNSLAKIEQYTDTKVKYSGNLSKAINKNKYIDNTVVNDSYKLYRVKQNNNVGARINNYQNEFIRTYKACKNMATAIKTRQYEKELTNNVLQRIIKNEKYKLKEKEIMSIIRKYDTVSSVSYRDSIIKVENNILEFINDNKKILNKQVEYDYSIKNKNRDSYKEIKELARSLRPYKGISFDSPIIVETITDIDQFLYEQDIIGFAKVYKDTKERAKATPIEVVEYEKQVLSLAKDLNKLINGKHTTVVSKNMAFSAKIKKFVEKVMPDIEVLSFDEDYA